MKKTYEAPRAALISLDAEEILAISGNYLLDGSQDSPAAKDPASNFGNVSLW